jgi:hypothetical protein
VKMGWRTGGHPACTVSDAGVAGEKLVCPLLAAAQLICERPQRASDAGQESPVEVDNPQEGL